MAENEVTETAVEEARSFLDGATVPETRPAHRPSGFTAEKATRILDLIANGVSLREVAKHPDFPGRATLHRWLRQNPEFAEEYVLAKEWAIDLLADDIVSIVDARAAEARAFTKDGDNTFVPPREISSAELKLIQMQVDNRKYLLERLMPRKYGAPVIPADETLPAPGNGDDAKTINGAGGPQIIDAEPMANEIDAWRKAAATPIVSPSKGGE